MTNEEAIKMLEYIRHTGNGESEYKNDAQAIAIDMAIKALEQQPCEDAISRQAVIDTLTKTSGIRGDALKALYDLPLVTPQPKVGHWIRVELGLFDSVSIRWECSECKKSDRFRSNYCFNCGAKMESDGEE